MANNRRVLFGLRPVILLSLGAFSLWSAAISRAQRVAASNAEHSREAQRVTVDVDNTLLATVLSRIARQAGLVPVFDPAIVPSTKRVTLHVHEIAATTAFEHALRGTGLVATVLPEGNVIIVRGSAATTTSGVITGRVIAVMTKQPLRGAKIGIDGSGRATETDDDGNYRLGNVSVGSHTVTVKLLGYTKASRAVAVQDNVTATVDFSLHLSATPLDQVVVTGMVIPTELKTVPNAITVITAKQIEERGITRIDQLFRGEVPGLFAQNQGSAVPFDEVTMFSRGVTAFGPTSAGVSSIGITNPIKTYVDGVELANASYLNQIDPKSIERIEIITGPQASTIYGSNAINGVMQIFTKRGTSSTPQLTLNLLSGWVENNFSSARTPQHDDNMQLNGVEGRLAYNAGASRNYIGPWTPAKQTMRVSGYGGARMELPTAIGRVTADITLRRTNTQNQQHGDISQRVTANRQTGWFEVARAAGVVPPTMSALTEQTIGFLVTHAFANWGSQEINLGNDATDTETRVTARGYTSKDDTTLRLSPNHMGRRSLRYTTTTRMSITSLAGATVTLGADSWQTLSWSMNVLPQALTGTLTNVNSLTRQTGHNAGGFMQAQVGFADQLFITYGLRAEWNPNFGANAQPNYAPRYGIAYTQNIGPVTSKLRMSYGRSTRPPALSLKTRETAADWGVGTATLQDYGNYDFYLANSELGPEYQQGGEGGFELYFGTRSSVVVTRYNQTVDGLIASPPVDSVRSFVPNPASGGNSPDAAGYRYQYQYQYLNIGSIRNQGWELQGSLNTGPLTTRGTYSWTKSRSLGITPKYLSYFTFDNRYQPGATFSFLPEHTWSMGTTYADARETATLVVSGVGQFLNTLDDFSAYHLNDNIRLSQNKLNMVARRYVSRNHGYALADITTTRRLNSFAEAIIQAQNVGNRYATDVYAFYAVIGRQVKAGLRLKWQ